MALARARRYRTEPMVPSMEPRDGFYTVNRAFMFTDLVNSTAWSARRDDINGYVLIRACLERMCEAVGKHRGELVKLTGDGLHSSFARPVDALRCAVAVQRTMAERRPGHPKTVPRARVGLSAGPCVRYTLCERVDYYGSTVNLAARLGQLGSGGDIMMAACFGSEPDVVELLSTFPVEVRDIEIRGFDGRSRIYRLGANQLHLVPSDPSPPTPEPLPRPVAEVGRETGR